MTVVVPEFDEATLEEVAGRLDLRAPNRDAIQTLALRMLRHYDDSQEPFEGVLDAATGVGKTYIIAGAVDYFATMGLRNFAVITPGQTILAKTVAQFTPGPKSLLGGLSVAPVVITSENFRTAAMRAAMEDTERVKLFVFTVQSLIKPSTRVGRRTHSFQEGLGAAFYGHLDALTDLVVFADEHHCYYGERFSAAVRDLTPLALVGLTGTPHRSTPEDQIIFRYPLTAAIADELVKTPVIVGRRDDLRDEHTQLLDGARLLETKQRSLDRYCELEGEPPVNAVMLVNCKDIAHAEEVGAFLRSHGFQGRRYAGAVLVVHSNQADAALAALDAVEEPDSPVRIIVQVGMLKEGWDVRTVYVIASLRASVSEILTEQTMGRGLRLPFGRYTRWDMLDTLDILAHEQYEKVLAKTKALHERFIDHRTVIERRIDMEGRTVLSIEQVPVSIAVLGEDRAPAANGADPQGARPGPALRVATQAERETHAAPPPPIHPLPDAPRIIVPVVESTLQAAQFSLADITEVAPYRELGRRLAAGDDTTLRRTRVGARIVTGPDGERTTQLAPSGVVDEIEAHAPGWAADDARTTIVAAVVAHRVVPGRAGEGRQVERLLREVAAGAGERADEILGRYPDRVARELIALILRDHRELKLSAQTREVVRAEPLVLRPRPGRHEVSTDHLAKFSRQIAYGGWRRSAYPLVTFDSGAERSLAVLLDGDDRIAHWVRLALDDLSIAWGGTGAGYHPDFLAIDREGVQWVVEVKADRDVEREDVQAKREAALRWANTVAGSNVSLDPWRYILVSESDLATARGSWSTLIATVD